jgi:putative transposase
MSNISYRRHRFPPEIIQHAVWLYFRFPLSYRNVEDLRTPTVSLSITHISCGG